jgi:hypothetical protein
MKTRLSSFRVASVFAVFLMFLSSLANAALDVTAVATQLTADGGGAITTIGMAVLGVAVIAASFKWAKAALFG